MNRNQRYETLHDYLLRHIKMGIIDFSIRAEKERGGGTGVQFYIHPAQVSGDTQDYILWLDPENDYDMIFNEKDVPPISIEKLHRLFNESQPKT